MQNGSAAIAHRAAVCCHSGTISATLGRPVTFDPATETFPGAPEATALASRQFRSDGKLSV